MQFNDRIEYLQDTYDNVFKDYSKAVKKNEDQKHIGYLSAQLDAIKAEINKISAL